MGGIPAFPEVERIGDPTVKRAVQLLFTTLQKVEQRVTALETAASASSTSLDTLTDRVRRLEDSSGI